MAPGGVFLPARGVYSIYAMQYDNERDERMKAAWFRGLCLVLVFVCFFPAHGLAVDYDVTIVDPGYGITATTPTPRAAPGDKVTIDYTYPSGWTTVGVYYFEDNGLMVPVALDRQSETRYTFTMPDDNVRIVAVESLIPPLIQTDTGGTEIPLGGSLTLTVSNTHIYANPQWLWYVDTLLTPISGETGPSLTVTKPGMYLACVTVGNRLNYSDPLFITGDPATATREITGFTIPGQVGQTVIQGTSIAITMPAGTDLTALVPDITHNGTAIYPLEGRPQDFTDPVQYTVLAHTFESTLYTVTVTLAPPDPAQPSTDGGIVSFTLRGQDGGTTYFADSSIVIHMPFGTDITALTPTILYAGTAIAPASGTPQDFTNPAEYIITLDDGSTKAYTVTVLVPTAPPEPAEPVEELAQPLPGVPMGGPGHEPFNRDKIPGKEYQKATTTAAADVYHKPGNGYAGQVYAGEVIELIEWSQDGQWCYIRFDNGYRVGWLSYRYIGDMVEE